MRDQDVHEKSLSAYYFLVKSNIPERLGLVHVQSRRANIYDIIMLSCIPTIFTNGLNNYLDTIDT
jgi:hypothetical protein